MATDAAALRLAAPAKINLFLHVGPRRSDGYHALQSLVCFADAGDVLSLAPSNALTLSIDGPFAAGLAAEGDNLILKAARALAAHGGIASGAAITLTKNLPVASGIGGGSADAAATLRLLARLNGIAPDDPHLNVAALEVGADVPVCLDARSRIMRGLGEKLSPPLTLPPLPAVLVNPGVPLATRAVFAKFGRAPGGRESLGDVPSQFDTLIEFLARHGNDLTDAAIACVPMIATVLERLRALPGVRLARMSGSGPTCFALFGSREEAAAAAQRLTSAHMDWWIAPANLASMR